jgi:hypothetical protein
VVVTKFNLYEGASIIAEYIVCYPSGEVIYTNGVDLDILLKKRIIYPSSKNKDYYVASDYYTDQVKEYVEHFQQPVFGVSRINIQKFLEECGLLPDQYKILDDLSIDVMSSINMTYKSLKKIPYKFNRCTSDFNCSHNNLKTLENAPVSVHGTFNCSFNDLETLEYGPKMVNRVYNCSNNYLTTLKGAPLKLKYFDCSDNLLTDLSYAPIVTDNFNKKNNSFS